MRPLEIVLIIIVAGALLRPFLGRFRNVMQHAYYIVTGLIVMALHIVLEGARWQMVPVYALIT